MGGGGFGICSPESGAFLHAVEDSRRGPNVLVAALTLKAKKVAMMNGVKVKNSKRVSAKNLFQKWPSINCHMIQYRSGSENRSRVDRRFDRSGQSKCEATPSMKTMKRRASYKLWRGLDSS